MQTQSQDAKPVQEPRITDQALGMWRAHPVTALLLQYLRDLRIQLADNIAKEIFNGRNVDASYISEVAIRCGVLQDVEELDASSINDFYGTEPQEEKAKNVSQL